MIEDVKKYIETNSYDYTLSFCEMMLTKLDLFIDTNNPSNDLEKFVLYKSLSCDTAFVIELLMKSIINNYNMPDKIQYDEWQILYPNGGDGHYLDNLFKLLSDEDKNTLSSYCGLSQNDLLAELSKPFNSQAVIKRYTNEDNTGIANYELFVKMIKGLFNIVGKEYKYRLDRVSNMDPNFDYKQYSAKDRLLEQFKFTKLKSELLSLQPNNTLNDYIVRNIISSDQALYCELVFKYFSTQKNAKTHDYAELHKKLDIAFKFLMAKGRYMNYCMVGKEYATGDEGNQFIWAFESLLFPQEFEKVHALNTLYEDVNKTFETSRYCTTSYCEGYCENYYNMSAFVKNVEDITKMCLGSEEEIHTIINNKNKLIELMGEGRYSSYGFTVNDVLHMDMIYVDELFKYDVDYYTYETLTYKTEREKNKVLYFLKYVGSNLPNHIDVIVDYVDGCYKLNEDNLLLYENAPYSLQFKKDKFINYCKLAKYIDNTFLYECLMNNISEIDIVTIYNDTIKKVHALGYTSEMIDILFKKYSYSYTNGFNYCDNRFFVYFQIFYEDIKNSKDDIDLSLFIGCEIERLLKVYSIFKKNNKVKYFYNQYKIYGDIDLRVLDELLKSNNEVILNSLYAFDTLDVFKIYKKYIDKYGDSNITNINPFIYSNNIDLIHIYFTKYSEYLDNNIMIYFYKEETLERIFNNIRFDYGEDRNYNFIHVSPEILESFYNYLESNNLMFYFRPSIISHISKNNKFEHILQYDLFKNVETYNDYQKKTIVDNIYRIIKSNPSKELLDTFNLEIYKDYPETLLLYNDTNNYIYDISIINELYKKVKEGRIAVSGAEIKLNDSEKDCLVKNILLNRILNTNEKSNIFNDTVSINVYKNKNYKSNDNCSQCYKFINFIDHINGITKSSGYTKSICTNKLNILLDKIFSFNDEYLMQYAFILASEFSKNKNIEQAHEQYSDKNGLKDFNCDLIVYLHDIFKDINTLEEARNYVATTNCMSLNMQLDLTFNQFDYYEEQEDYVDIETVKTGEVLLDKVKGLLKYNISFMNRMGNKATDYVSDLLRIKRAKMKMHKLNRMEIEDEKRKHSK